jgi:monoamine oxidase
MFCFNVVKGKIELGEPASEIRQEEGRVYVTTKTGKKFRGRSCVVAMTPSLAGRFFPLFFVRFSSFAENLGRIEYSPPLPALRQQLCNRVMLGSIIKTHAFYDRPYWIERGYSGSYSLRQALC